METYRKKTKKFFKFYQKLIIFFALLFLFIFLFLLFVVNPIIVFSVENNVKTYAAMAINNAALEVFDYSIGYDDLIDIERDADGNVLSLSVNSARINRLTLETVSLSQLYVNSLSDKNIGVPLGTLTGLSFLSGFGPEIKFNIVPAGAVFANFKSVFESAGINQTRHMVIVEVVADIKVVLLMKNTVIQSVVNIYVAENIIVGKIPDVYLSVGSGKLSLVP